VTGITPGSGIQLQFAGDAPGSFNFDILATYDSTTPQVGDLVLCDEFPLNTNPLGGSSYAARNTTILGKVTQPTAPTGNTVPTGTVVQFAGSSAPANWLICDGSAVSRTTYANLFGVISTTYGIGDGSTTFNLPNCAGKVAVGVGDAGGTFHGHTNHTLAQTGGEETHLLSTSEMPIHSHTEGAHTHTIAETNVTFQATAGGTVPTFNQGSGLNTGSAAGSGTGNAGSGSDHNNLQPYIVFNYIVRI
jgi:microcystin-dependent protein